MQILSQDAYFSVLLHPESQKFVRFQWKGQLFQFLCLCFDLGPAPKIFRKLLKISVALLRKLMVQPIILLDQKNFSAILLIMVASIEELTLARDSLIYLLQGLGFVINIKKSVLRPCQTIEFLGVEINSKDMVLILPEGKKNKIVEQCWFLLKNPLVTIRELSHVISRLASTAITVLPAPLQYKAMQRQQIMEFSIEKITIQR